MDKKIITKNGEIRVHDNGVDIKNSSKNEKLNYSEITKINYSKATIKEDGIFDVHTKDKGIIRLRFGEKDNDNFLSIKNEISCKEPILNNKKAIDKNPNLLKGLAPVICIVIGIAFIYIQHEIINDSVNTSINSYMTGDYHNTTFDELLSAALYIIGIAFIGIGLALFGVKFKPQNSSKAFSSNNINQKKDNVDSVTEELKKYKALLDDGTITQEEFEFKKKQILGL